MKNFNKRIGIYWTLGILLLSGMFTMTITASKNPYKSQKKVTSVKIQKGDTLWNIAKQYYTEENCSMKAYIDEIVKCNHLSSSQIQEGINLIIPYYEKK